jgi:hypothetical protein
VLTADFHGRENNQRFSTEKPGNCEKTRHGTAETLIGFRQHFAYFNTGLFVDGMRLSPARPTQSPE